MLSLVILQVSFSGGPGAVKIKEGRCHARFSKFFLHTTLLEGTLTDIQNRTGVPYGVTCDQKEKKGREAD